MTTPAQRDRLNVADAMRYMNDRDLELAADPSGLLPAWARKIYREEIARRAAQAHPVTVEREVFFKAFVTRGNSTFAYSAEEYDTLGAVEDEARRLFSIGEAHVGIVQYERVTSRQFIKGMTPATDA